MLKTVSSITNAIGALNYKGTWNATTNTPTITSSVGVKGDYYQVSVAGSTAINGISNWGVGDVIAFNGTTWQRIEGGADLNGVNLSVSGTTTLSGLTASTALALNAGKDVVSVTNTGTGNNVLADGPTLTTPDLGVATATSVNKVAITAPTNGSTLTIADGKTLTANNSLTLAGTDATTMTFPTTSATIARTDAGQTFTGVQVMTSPRVLTSINDTNGNELFGVTATGSAVNEFTVANAATGAGPTLSATGTDTNIDINITPKGTGEVNLSKVDIDGGAIDGTTIGSSSASTGVFTQLDVDNIRVDGNTVSSTNTNGNIIIDPNGSGGVLLKTTTPRWALSSGGVFNLNAAIRTVGGSASFSTGIGTLTMSNTFAYSSFSRIFNNQASEVANVLDFVAGYTDTGGNRVGIITGKIQLRGNQYPSTSSTAFNGVTVCGSIVYTQIGGSMSGLSLTFSIVSGDLKVEVTNTTANFGGGSIVFYGPHDAGA